MKIIFNSTIADWYCQIYDELKRNHEVILPENYKDRLNKNAKPDLDALEKCVSENKNLDFIFDFRAELNYLLKWNARKIDVPLVIFLTNTINNRHKAKMSLFAKTWYVEKYATIYWERYNRENLIFEGMAANPYIYYPMKTQKLYDISFFGRHYGERGYWINLLENFANEKKLTHIFL